MTRIKNGGVELGILQIIAEDKLSEKDKERKAYLENLPKDVWITLDENGKALSPEEAEKRAIEHAKRFKFKP